MEKTKYDFIVETHLKNEPTRAVSQEKALNNVKYRYRKMGFWGPYTYWKVRKA